MSTPETTPPDRQPPQEPSFRDPYAEQTQRAAEIINSRGDDLGGEQTGYRYDPKDLGVIRDIAKQQRSRPFEIPGNNSRMNEQLLTPAQAQSGLTPEQIDEQQAINSEGRQKIRDLY